MKRRKGWCSSQTGIAKYASLRSILHNQSPFCRRSRTTCNPSILKCTLGRKRLSGFRFTTGLICLVSFLGTRNIVEQKPALRLPTLSIGITAPFWQSLAISSCIRSSWSFGDYCHRLMCLPRGGQQLQAVPPYCLKNPVI